MKFRLLLITALFLGLTTAASAQGRQNKITLTRSTPAETAASETSWYIAPEAFWWIADKNTLGNALFVGGRAGYQFSPNFAVEIESGWVQMDIYRDVGEITVVPLMANLRTSLMGPDSIWDFFAVSGLGVSFNDLSLNATSGSQTDTAIAGQLGAGVEYRFSKQVAMIAEVRYFWSRPDLDIGKDSPGNFDEYAILAGGNLVFKF